MSYKIFTKENYFLIQDNDTNIEFEGLSKEVRIRRLTTGSDNFYFDNVNNWKDEKTGVNIADIQDESGTPYTLQGFVDWYRANTGNFNGGGSAPTLDFIPLAGTEVGNPVTGNIKIEENTGIEIYSQEDGTARASIIVSQPDEGVRLHQININESTEASLYVNTSNVLYNTDDANSKGFISNTDHSANYTPLSYVQKIYVDNAILNIPTITFGDIKTGIQTQDHDGWIKLDGRGISTLTSTQQAQATSLGFTMNLPNQISGNEIRERFTGVAISGTTINYTKVRGKNWIRYLIEETGTNNGNEIFTFPEAFTSLPVATSGVKARVLSEVIFSRVYTTLVTTTNVTFGGTSSINAFITIEGEAAENNEIPNVFIYLGL